MTNKNKEADDSFTNRDLEKEFSELETKSLTKAAQAATEIGAGTIPFVGGLFAWIASNWSDKEQERINDFFFAYLQLSLIHI